jgi:antitoxin component YwqK of YwqJK toxin-antitoxin module
MELDSRSPYDLLNADIWLIIAMNYPAVFCALTGTCRQLCDLLTDPKITTQAKQKFAKRQENITWDNAIMIRYILPNGQPHGTCEEWNNQRIRISFTHYVDGQLHGVKKRLHANGKLMYLGYYVNGKLHGICQTINDQGIRTRLEHYDTGKLHGTYEEWNDQGIRILRCNYNNNLLHGVLEEWNQQGTRIRLGNYNNGKRHGVCEQWTDRGVPSIGYYINGILQT